MGQQDSQPASAPKLPGFVFEWSAKRNSRTGKIENEIVTVRGMNEKYFFDNVDRVRVWLQALPTVGRQSASPQALAAAEPPTQCPECGGKEWYDNRSDEKPNFRCKNKNCGYRILLPSPDENQPESEEIDE